jgi:hypothetical protein
MRDTLGTYHNEQQADLIYADKLRKPGSMKKRK